MGQIKLEEPGDEHTMKVAEVVLDESGTWPSVLFYGEDGDYIKMTKKTAVAKLERLHFTLDNINGIAQKEALWLKFGRDENPNRGQSPYWSVELAEKRRAAGQQARAGERAPALRLEADRAPARQPAGNAGHSGNTVSATIAAKQPIGPIYLECVRFVALEVLPLLPQNMLVDTNAFFAAVATVFIRTEKQPGPLMPQPVNSRRPATLDAPPPPTDDDFDAEYSGQRDDE